MAAGTASAAEVKAPAQVTGVKVTGRHKRVTVSWKAVKNVSGYYLYQYEGKKQTRKTVARLSAKTLSKEVPDLKNGKTYTFAVAAFKAYQDDSGTWGEKMGKTSKKVTGSPKASAVPNPVIKKVREGDGSVKVVWEKVKGAKSYDVSYRLETATKTTRIATGTKKRNITIKKLKNGKNYCIYIRANGVNSKKKAIHSEWVRVNARPFNENSEKALLSQINHTSAYAGGYDPHVVYDDRVAEAFANYGYEGGKFWSATDYFLWLNTHGLHLYIFKKSDAGRWKVLYKFPVAIGRSGAQTPSGLWTLDTQQYKDDHGSFYVLYCTFFTGYDTNSIHSQCYPIQQDPLQEGYFGSAGGVRCDLKYAKFVYENCEKSRFLVR